MQLVLRRSLTGIPLMLFTLIVFLSPLLRQITGSNYVKLIDDFAYLLMLLVSINLLFKRSSIPVKVGITTVGLFILIAVSLLIAAYYNGFMMIAIQMRELKYLLLPVILLPYADRSHYKYIWPTLKVIAALCVPVSIIQWMLYKSHGDSVTGLLGNGGSGTLTLFVLIMFFSELSLRLKSNGRIWGWYCLYLIPTALNETKITILLIPIMLFSVLFLCNKIRFSTIIAMVCILVILFSGWAFLYQNTYGMSFTEIFSPEYIHNYLFATDWIGDAGRFAKVEYAFDIIKNGNPLFGYGMGASYMGATSGIRGFILNQYYTPEMFGGTRTQLFTSLIDNGLLGTCAILCFLIAIFIKVLRKNPFSLEKAVAVNLFIVVFIAFIYNQIFYTYQIMYMFVFFVVCHLQQGREAAAHGEYRMELHKIQCIGRGI